MYAADPDKKPRRRTLVACPYCGANGAACDSLLWLRGRTCCEACDGNHEEVTEC